MSSSGFAALCSAFGRYDVVHIHAEGPAFFAWLPKLLGKRVVVTIHGIDWQREKWKSGFGSKYIRQGEKNAVKYADEVIVLSKMVQCTFNNYKETQAYKDAVLSTASVLKLSKASVTSYLPYEKGVYFSKETPVEKISVGAERQRRYRAVRKLRTEPTEEHLWEVVLLYSGVRFKTYSGLPFTYEIRKGRNGQYTKELWIDRRENSKSLAWSSVLLALNNIKEVGAVVDRPKALGDIRGVTYIYGMFYRFGLIDMPDKVNGKMKRAGRQM